MATKGNDLKERNWWKRREPQTFPPFAELRDKISETGLPGHENIQCDVSVTKMIHENCALVIDENLLRSLTATRVRDELASDLYVEEVRGKVLSEGVLSDGDTISDNLQK